MFKHKAQFRRVVEAAGVPYTYISCNCFAGIFIKTLAQLDATDPPRDKVVILGDGNMKGTFESRAFLLIFHSGNASQLFMNMRVSCAFMIIGLYTCFVYWLNPETKWVMSYS